MIQIVTDSATELKSDPDNGLHVVELPLLKNGQPLQDCPRQAFYKFLEQDDVTLSTSQASPAVFEQLFGQLSAKGDEVLYIALSSTLSGTFNSARLAAADITNVWLVDSMEACLSQTALVLRALQLRDEGYCAGDIARRLNEEKKDCVLLAAVPSLKYLKKGGRISPAKAAIGELANIKPIVTVDEDGQVGVAARTRGMKKAVRQCAALAAGAGIDPDRPVVIGYSGLDDSAARALAADLEEVCGYRYQGAFYPLSPVLATHAGPDAAGIGFFALSE